VSTTQHRLPDFLATTVPFNVLMLVSGVDAADPREVLLLAVYRLAARLERRIVPWDGEGAELVGTEHVERLLSAPYGVYLTARIGAPGDLTGAGAR
jgi:hypothetical protein